MATRVSNVKMSLQQMLYADRDYWDIDSWWYEDNSHLVDKKIEELEKELNKRLKESGE